MLVRNDLENPRKVTRADQRQGFQGSSLLFLLYLSGKRLISLACLVGKSSGIKTKEGYVVDCKSGLLSELSGEGTVLKACEHVSSHAELDELDLKVLKTLQLLLDHIVNIVCVYC